MKNQKDILWVTKVILWNDERAFSNLMMKYLPQVRQYFIIQTKGDEAASDDLTQETFIKAWHKIRGFKQLSSFQTWLYRIAFNTFIDYTRKTDNNTISIDKEGGIYEIPDNTSPPPTEQEETLKKAVYNLNEKERQCVTLFYLEEMNIKEIQKITGYPAGSIKCYLSRGRNNLEKILKNNEEER